MMVKLNGCIFRLKIITWNIEIMKYEYYISAKL